MLATVNNIKKSGVLNDIIFNAAPRGEGPDEVPGEGWDGGLGEVADKGSDEDLDAGAGEDLVELLGPAPASPASTQWQVESLAPEA